MVQVTIGSGFSACYQNACLAAQGFDNVFVVDSENLSSGQGLLVMEAVRLAEAGQSGEDIARALRERITRLGQIAHSGTLASSGVAGDVAEDTHYSGTPSNSNGG